MRARSLLLTSPHQLSWVEEELPSLQPHEILIQTITGAVSIGTELPLFLGIHRGSQPVNYPRMTGYESLGKVLASGSAVDEFQVGERVVSSYGHRTHVVVPAGKAIPIPDDVPDSIALLCILSCDVTKGIDKVRPMPDDLVLVTGAGTIGLLTLFNLIARGIKNVDVVEPLANRRNMAGRLGAKAVFEPEKPTSISIGYSIGFECSSRNQAFEALQHQLAPGGKICVLSDGNLEPLCLTPCFHEKELTVIGSSDGVNYREHARWFFKNALKIDNLLADLYEMETILERLPDLFERIVKSGRPPMKVLVHYE